MTDELKLSEMLGVAFGSLVGTVDERILHDGDFILKGLCEKYGKNAMSQLTDVSTRTWVSAWDMFDKQYGRSCHCL